MSKLTKFSSGAARFFASSVSMSSAFSHAPASHLVPSQSYRTGLSWTQHRIPFPLASERGCTNAGGRKASNQTTVWKGVTVRSLKLAAVLLEEWWHALFTTRTDTLPLFCSRLGERSTSRWFSRDSIKLVYASESLKLFTDSPSGEDKWWTDLH